MARFGSLDELRKKEHVTGATHDARRTARAVTAPPDLRAGRFGVRMAGMALWLVLSFGRGSCEAFGTNVNIGRSLRSTFIQPV